MRSGKFRTNKRLWLILSLALFLPLWFVPWVGKGAGDRAFDYVRAIPRKDSDAIKGTVFFFFFYGIPAVCVAWPLQALVVVMRTRNTGNDQTV